MSSSQAESMRNSAVETAEKKKQVGNEKSQQATNVASEKLGQAKQGAANAAQATSDKSGKIKDQAADVAQNAGGKVSDTLNSIKKALTVNSGN